MMVAPLVCKSVRLKRVEYIYIVHLVVLKSKGDIDMILGIGIRDQTLNPPSLDLVD